MLVVVAFEVGDTALSHDSATAYLAALRHSGLRLVESREHTLSMVVPNDTAVVSIEVIGAMTKHAARARYTIDPLPRPNAWSLSDLLFFHAEVAPQASDVSHALSHAITERHISASQPLGVFWELGSPAATTPVWTSLSVEPTRVGFARRLATRIHLARPLAPVRLRWQTVAQPARTPQSVTLRLPSSARGSYRVVLTIQPPSGPPVSSWREIEVER
jgi:hypothetical protein